MPEKHVSVSRGERLSALVDGELGTDEAAQVWSDMQQSDAETWHCYQVIGDAMRAPELVAGASSLRIWEQIEQRVYAEVARPVDAPVQVVAPMQTLSVAANRAPHWRSWLGYAASLLVVGVMGVQWGTQQASVGDTAMQAAVPTVHGAGTDWVVAGSAPEPVMIRDPYLDELMAAHQQMAGHSALQGPSGFLRNATFERPAR